MRRGKKETCLLNRLNILFVAQNIKMTSHKINKGIIAGDDNKFCHVDQGILNHIIIIHYAGLFQYGKTYFEQTIAILPLSNIS